jgi:hypothetical protein
MPDPGKSKRAEKDRQTWLQLLEQLEHQVEGWAKDRRWSIHRDQKQLHESQLGTYMVPVLTIRAPSGQVHLDPIARYVQGGEGRVDLLAWPSLTRMLLIRIGEEWVVKTDSGVEWPERWSESCFEHLVKSINAAA